MSEVIQMEKRCYTVEELHHMLGISRRAVYELLKKRYFSWVLIGGRYRISKNSFDAWLDEQHMDEELEEIPEEEPLGAVLDNDKSDEIPVNRHPKNVLKQRVKLGMTESRVRTGGLV